MISSAFVPDFASGRETSSEFASEFAVPPSAQIISLAAGYRHTLARKNDGTVWAWGSNYAGQLGLGDTANRSTPVQITSLGSNVTALTAGGDHSLVLKNDGTVWAWGWNNYGQLGLGDISNHYSPAQITALGNNVMALTAGSFHTLALKGDGTVWAWGHNGYGQLGLGDNINRSSPVQVTALGSNVTALTAGSLHTLALKGDGTVWAWGLNNYGQLGLGDTANRSTPVQITSLGSNVTALTAGYEHALALKGDGTVWAWGRNNLWQLGLVDIAYRSSPVQVTNLGSNVAALAAGAGHSLALKGGGTVVWAWGDNSSGQLGLGDDIFCCTPMQVSALGNNVAALAAGGYHTLALKGDGTVWAWGWNAFGQLGLGDTINRFIPVQVPITGQLPPTPPSGLTATAISSSQINLSWTDNSNNETVFKIERKTGTGGSWSQIATVGANVTSYSNTGLAVNATYTYRVRASNAAGDSAYSNEASATTSNGTQYNQALFSGWNMVTVGLQTSLSPAQLFGSQFQGIYRWDPTAGSYFTPQALEPGLGYWVKMGVAATITVQGTPLVSRTLPLSTGWNQVGSPFASITPWSTVKVVKETIEYTAVAAASAGWIIPAFSWNGTSYVTADYASGSMGVGQGFWLKANTAGMSLLFGQAGESETVPITAAQGGKVELSDGATLTIPPQALNQNTIVSITKQQDLPPGPSGQTVEIGYDISLGGATAVFPLEVQLPVPASIQKPVVGHWNGASWDILLGQIANGFITIHSKAFSTMAVLSNTSLPEHDGWHAGDSHVHTGWGDWPPKGASPETSGYSDGSETVENLATIASNHEMDWLILTDHTKYDLGTYHRALQDYWSDYVTACATVSTSLITVLPGQEVSTKVDSHYLAYGMNRAIDNKTLSEEKMVTTVNTANSFGVVAHPFNSLYGWNDWEVLEKNRGLEIISSGPFVNEQALSRWDGLLAAKLPETSDDPDHLFPVATAGSDIHGDLSYFGRIMNYLYTGSSNTPNSSQVYDALKHGRVVVSTDGSIATMNVNGAVSGGYIEVASGDSLEVQLSGESRYYAQTARIKLHYKYDDGSTKSTVYSTDPIKLDLSYAFPRVSIPLGPVQNDGYVWARVDFLFESADGRVSAESCIINPVFFKVGAQNIPNPPSGLTASAVSSSQINLSWTDSNNETGFKIERKTGAGSWSQIATVGANVTSYSNTGLAANTTYTYRVRAYNAAGDSAYSNEASATTWQNPQNPLLYINPTSLDFGTSQTSLQFTVKNNGGGTLNWSASESADWITNVSPANGSLTAGQSTPVTVNVSRSGKSPGTYNHNISVTSNGGTGSVAVSMTVQGGTPTINITRPTPNESLTIGSQYTLQWTAENLPGGHIEIWYDHSDNNWRLITEAALISQTSYNWTVPNDPFNNCRLSVGNVDIGGYGATDTEIFKIVPGAQNPLLSLNPTSLDFGTSGTSLQFTVKNNGSGTLNWSASESADWITSVNPASGSLTAGQSTPVTVIVSRSGKSAGPYNHNISVTSNGGNGSVAVSMTVQGGTPKASIVAGDFHTLAMKNDGTVWAWGANANGQLGLGDYTSRSSPVQVTALGNNVVALVAGLGHSLALKGDGTVWAWGANIHGQLGLGDYTSHSSPVQVTALGSNVTALAAGEWHTLARKGDGSVWAWGANDNGQLGLGDYTSRSSPVQVTALGSNVASLAASGYHTLALKGDGTVWAWGNNWAGQLGLGDTTDRSSPVQVTALGSNVVALVAGWNHTLALKGDGTVWAWGYNYYGQLGLGDAASHSSPVQVTALGSNVTTLAAGGQHTLALKGDGTVWAWGFNTSGQLGLGDTTHRSSPVQVTALGSNVTALAAGANHTLALKGDGTVWAWGYNYDGELGLGDTTNRSNPVQVPLNLNP
jgi:alpha-tubulin suppressor-like RCC1 family protein